MSNILQPVIDSDGKKILTSHYTRVCQNIIPIIVKGAISNDILNVVKNKLDKLTIEVERMLHQININDVNNENQKKIYIKIK